IIPVSKFKENAELLLKKIRQGSSSFEIPEVEDFRGEAMAECIKAPSSKKADITIVVHDNRTGVSPTLSFSIKSQLGNPSTLLNSAQNTNFIFRLSNKITRDQLNEINSIDSQLERMRKLEDNSVILTFEGIQDSKRNGNMYFCNLQNIDTSMPDIMAQFVLIAVTNSLSSVKDITSKMTELNPLGFNFSHHHTFYETKIKRLLVDAALGMKPGELWNGKYEANGGYLVVKDDGDVLCYHIYNKNDFEDYLFNNVKIDYPSRTRHDYGYIYEENGCQKIKLNFQIRFIR
ncbi:MAG: HpaII family restriction endonuclease, partial [Prevotella sp.]|nr:HpaII family restriction endonuclease [Prevotella sp.]